MYDTIVLGYTSKSTDLTDYKLIIRGEDIMNEINKSSLGSKDIYFPGPIASIVTGTEEKYNIITVALMGLVNCDPPMLSFTLSKSRYSCELINKNKKVSINIASTNQMSEIDFCGLVSGRNYNKFENLSLTLTKVNDDYAPIIKESPFNYIGEVIKEVEFDSMIMYIMEIKDILIDNDKLDEKNNINIKDIDPLVYCTTIREYWSLDKKIGEGYKEGNQLI